MKIISHRGNLDGPNPEKENSISYITQAINLGYDVEIDVWKIGDGLFLGHDEPQYEADLSWFVQNKESLWIHCKNIPAIIFFNKCSISFNYFWHENDTVTLTSKGFIWAYPGKQPIKNSIAVMPEIYEDDIRECHGICSDYVNKLRDELGYQTFNFSVI